MQAKERKIQEKNRKEKANQAMKAKSEMKKIMTRKRKSKDN